MTFADPRIANLEIDALREALRVMAAAGIPPLNMEKYPLGTLAPLLRFGPRALLRPALHRIVGGARGGKMPSLFLDLDAGKCGSEIGWYNGAIVRKGEEVGVETPVNLLLTQTVRQLVAQTAVTRRLARKLRPSCPRGPQWLGVGLAARIRDPARSGR